eukprot:1647263-Rhodomonas_salina.1
MVRGGGERGREREKGRRERPCMHNAKSGTDSGHAEFTLEGEAPPERPKSSLRQCNPPPIEVDRCRYGRRNAMACLSSVVTGSRHTHERHLQMSVRSANSHLTPAHADRNQT